ncbi:hypothetical protein SYNPS1DRAFT_26778 [Syncephalis pseudoplumigaleata]|uniref:Uncharacterized protein n=1 Tax=Syncephalis pseudoplumigaleata TaxID=1712513 RepID=A0A4P9Z633_9FUNG|nr:hypothetical protein SYNPS1DRAFT_26778 [Syncephalis pseudoplumigaleata]|eukprot:RKP27572.1 hypothetical protein SYNPS1DRAFT_26778 [Syncephalis pseudoplumigaleata]
MFSQVFVLNEEGTPLVRKDYRYDTPSDALYLLTDRLLEKLDTPPIYRVDELYLAHVLYGELYIGGCCRTKPASSAEALETLTRLGQLIVGVCGAPEEALVRKHDVLVYELLEEALTDGYPTRVTMVAVSAQLTAHPLPSEASLSSSTSGVVAKLSHLLLVSTIRSALPGSSGGGHDFDDEALYLDIIERIHCIFDEDVRATARHRLHASSTDGHHGAIRARLYDRWSMGLSRRGASSAGEPC